MEKPRFVPGHERLLISRGMKELVEALESRPVSLARSLKRIQLHEPVEVFEIYNSEFQRHAGTDLQNQVARAQDLLSQLDELEDKPSKRATSK